MNLYIICCYTGKYHNNVEKVLSLLNNFNFITLIIINQTSHSVPAFEVYNEVITDNIGVSKARNIGFKIASNLSISSNDYIYFWDEDIIITKEIINSFKTISNLYNYDAIIYAIKGISGGKIGNNLIHFKLFRFLNAYRLGNPSFIFNLSKIRINFDEKIGPGKKPIIAAEDTLFVLKNNFFKFYIPDIKINFIHPDAEEINNINKIYNYSISQGYIASKLRIIDKIIFILIVLHRPVFGIFLNYKNSKLYRLRIYGFIYGYKKSFNF